MKEKLHIGDIVLFDWSDAACYIYRGRTNDKENAHIFDIVHGRGRYICPDASLQADYMKVIGKSKETTTKERKG